MNPYLSIVSALAVWSTWGLAVRGLDVPASVILFYNALFGLVFQGAALLFISRRTQLDMTGGLLPATGLAVAGTANMVLFLYALKVTTVAVALLTHYTAPVFVAVLAPMILGDRADTKTLAAIAISSAGLALIFLTGQPGSLGGQPLLGALAGTGSGLAYAFVIIISRGISGSHHPLKLVFIQGLVAAAAMAVVVLPAGTAVITPGDALIYAVLGLVHSTAGVAIYLYGIRRVSAQEAGVLGYLEPALAIFFAFIFLGETPGAFALIGGAMILASGTVVIMGGSPRLAGGTDDYRG